MGYIWPVDPDVYEVTQEFGNAPNNGVNPPGGHTGRDFATPIGTPIVAVGDGVIDFAGQADWTPNDNPLWMMGSICIILNCGDAEPDFTYGHLSSVTVAQGERVGQGQVIGYTGNSGISTGPHLHFEALPPGYVLDQWTYGRVDPRRYCSGYVSGISAQATTITPITPQEGDMTEYKDWSDESKNQLLNDLWRGRPGADIPIMNRRLNRAEWPETTLGSLEDRIQNEILPQALAGIKATVDPAALAAAIPADVAADVAAELGKRLQTPPAAPPK